tara:strand:+ start:281 stop:490 length:210 start_codon:yes stop_codon:yes gene_type:complete
MIIPIRCFTCGKCISNVWPKYIKELNELKEESPTNKATSNEFDLLEKYKIKRYCCRRMILSCVELVEKI